MRDFLSDFEQYFEIVSAESAEQIRACQHLRYQVFCRERNILDSADLDQECEYDAYDRRSVHAMLQHKPSGVIAATVRLILADPQHADARFPIEHRLQFPLSYQGIDLSALPRKHVSEVSRFTVAKQFRMRAGENQYAVPLPENLDRRQHAPQSLSVDRRRQEDRRHYPHISMGLIKAVLRMSARHGIQYWYAGMEPPFVRLLTRFGIYFHALGPVVDYHGQRQPCIVDANRLIDRVYKERRDVWRFITEGGKYLPTPTPGQDYSQHVG